jgi:hypothetical protein
MSGAFDKLLGFIVWKGAKWYVRRRWRTAPRWIGIVALGAGIALGGVVRAQRRRCTAA